MLFETFLMTLVLANPGIAVQEEDEKPKPKWLPPEIERAADVEDLAAKEAIKVFTKAFGAASEITDKKYAMDDLAKSRHRKIATVFEKILLRDREGALRCHAARCLAKLGMPESESSLIKAFTARINRDDDDVLEAVGIALGQTGKKSLYSKFGRKFEEVGKGGKSGMALLFGYRQDEDALRLLSQWLDEPRPTNVDSPSNPPASYWKQRFAEYHYVRDEVVWAIWRITGELIQSEDEFREWEKKKKEEEKNERRGMRRRRG